MSNSSELTAGRHQARPVDLSLLAPAVGSETIDISGGDHSIASPIGAKGLFVGGAGAIKVRMAAGNDQVYTGVVAGVIMPIQFDIVYQTGTDASNMVALL